MGDMTDDEIKNLIVNGGLATVREAAAILGMCRETIYDRIAAGEARIVGRPYRVVLADLMKPRVSAVARQRRSRLIQAAYQRKRREDLRQKRLYADWGKNGY